MFLTALVQVKKGDWIEFSVSHDTMSWSFEWPMPIPRFPEIQSSEVLRWHWAMLMDERRNGAYQQAIQKVWVRRVVNWY